MLGKVFEKALEEELGTTSLGFPEEALSEQPITNPSTVDEILIGRENEIKSIAKGIGGSIKGLFKHIIIVGEKGAGKTSLGTYLLKQQEKQKKFSIIRLTQENYAPQSILNELYRTATSQLTYDLIIKEGPQAREGPKKEKNQKLQESLEELSGFKKIFLEEKTPTIQEINSAYSRRFGFKDEEKSAISFLLEELNSGDDKFHLFIMFDDAHLILTDDKELKKKVTNFIKEIKKTNEQVSEIYLTYPKTVNLLTKESDEAIKDAAFIQLKALTPEECKELLVRRLKKIKKIETKPINPTEILNPFKETAVEYAGLSANGNPLRFLKILRGAFEIAKEKKIEIIGLKKIDQALEREREYKRKKINANSQKLINAIMETPIRSLTFTNETEKKVLEEVTEKPGVTREEISNRISLNHVSIHHYLHNLMAKGLVARKKIIGKNKYQYFRKNEKAGVA